LFGVVILFKSNTTEKPKTKVYVVTKLAGLCLRNLTNPVGPIYTGQVYEKITTHVTVFFIGLTTTETVTNAAGCLDPGTKV